MRGIPSYWGALDEPGCKPFIFQDRSHSRRSYCGSAGTGRNRLLFLVPVAIVPLSNEAAPILDGQIDRLVPNLEVGLLIAIRGSSQNVHAVKFAGRQRDGLAFGND